MTVYADSLFLLNFISEYILICICEKIIYCTLKLTDKIIAAVCGSVIAVIIFITALTLPANIVIRLTNAGIISFICCRKKRHLYLRFLSIFIILSYVYAGIFTAVAGFMSKNAVIKNGITYSEINTGVFLLVFICTYPLILLVSRIIKHKKRIFDISLTYRNETIDIKALSDSGNLLKFKGEGVLIAEWDSIKKLFSISEYSELYEHISEFDLSVIPYSSLGAKGKMLIVFFCDNATIKDTSKVINNIPIGIIEGKIAPNGTYSALIGAEYIEGAV